MGENASVGTMPSAGRKEKVLERREIEDMIAKGAHIFIIDNKVIKMDAFMRFHPGGELAMKHMVGRDATDEVKALHSPEAQQKMIAFQIGRVEGKWLNFTPPLQGGRYRTLDDNETEEDTDDTEHEVSAPPSPIFEQDFGQGLRRRAATPNSDTSISSTTKISDAERPVWIDARTQEEIRLDLSTYPSPDPKTQEFIVQKYRELNQRFKDEGLYECNYWNYFREFLRYSALAISSYIALRAGWYCTSAVFLGFLWHILVFTAHDAGHMGITHNFHFDTTIGIIIADFIGGLSLGWWKRSHNVHHIVTNSFIHDPDIQHIPFFAITPQLFKSLRSTYYERIMKYDWLAQFLISKQNYLYYPILFFARFNLYRLSWEYFLRGQAPKRGIAWWHKWLELTGQVFFWIWFGYGVLYKTLPDWKTRLLFLVISHGVASPLHVQITISHFGMSTSDLGTHESFAQKMLRTTMDIDCPTWMDFYHGGLQYQAVHHLFPRVPRHNLRRGSELVKEWCKEVNIPYVMFTFTAGNKYVIGHMAGVAKMAKILDACRKAVGTEDLVESVVKGN